MKFTGTTKEEKSWILYDWANSSYATIAMVAVLPIYFAQITGAAGVDGDLWWGLGTSAATFTLAFMAPVLGALGDYRGMKKKLFCFFLALGLLFTGINIFTDSWRLMLAGYSLSYLGFLGANLFYDSFLTDVTTPERMDRISALGYGMGYIGGSTIPFLACLALILFGERFGVGAVLAVKLSLAINVIWWAAFSLPILLNVRQKYYLERPRSGTLRQAFANTRRTFSDIFQNKAIFYFMISYFFYIDGVNTVINMATSFGATLGLDTNSLVVAILVIQLIAFPCTILSVRLSDKIGVMNTLLLFMGNYTVIAILGFVMGWGVEFHRFSADVGIKIFWALSILVGTSQGGIQALSRSFFGRLVPPEKSNEYFGFYDIFGKFAAVMGPAMYALVKAITGYSCFAILALSLLFIAGMLVMLKGRREIRLSRPLGTAGESGGNE